MLLEKQGRTDVPMEGKGGKKRRSEEGKKGTREEEAGVGLWNLREMNGPNAPAPCPPV